MADRSGIEWTDATWNPVTGCTEVSPGCDHCYARTFAERWRGTPGHHFERGFDLVLRPERMDQPQRWTRPRRIFVNSMSDLFHVGVEDDYIACVFAVMASTQRHTYQVLTKRHGRMRSLLSSDAFRVNVVGWLRHWADEEDVRFEDDADAVAGGRWPLPNVWLGVSVENQQWADIRIPALLDTPAAVRWLSCEPLLGPVDLGRWLDPPCPEDPDGLHYVGCGCDTPDDLHWVVAGGESGPDARPMHPAWTRSLRDQCTAAGVPFHFKQWGAWLPYEDDAQPPFLRGQNGELVDGHRLPATLTDHDPVDGWWWPEVDEPVYRRVGKKKAGRELDGRTWDEYPTVSAGSGAGVPARPGGTTGGQL